MSKITKLAEQIASTDFGSKQEVIAHADMVLAGRHTITKKDAIAKFGEAADMLDIEFSRMKNNMDAVIRLEASMSIDAKKLTSRAKDSAGQISDALARLNTIIVKDMDAKLTDLERLVVALEKLDELNKRGVLATLLGSLQGIKVAA